jgi:hypothetical protein
MDEDYIQWIDELRETYSDEQVAYLVSAKRLVDLQLVASADDIQAAMGYGIVDEAMLRDTFFST